ncbi:MAG: SDR family NAD(P)-dependent oxidoreductase [Caldilineaceae bacterium]
MSRRVSFELTDKVVVVTGAGRGIGKAIAEVCAEYGAKLALGSRTVAESEATAEVCRAVGVEAEAWPLDVSSVASIREFIDNVLARYGRIDVLVSNAGYNSPKPALDYTEEEFDYISDVNFKGAFFIATAVAQSMIDRKIEGSIITISSQVGIVGGPLRDLRRGQGCGGSIHPVTGRGMGAERHHRQRRRPHLHATPLLEEAVKNPEFAKNLQKSPWAAWPNPTKWPPPSSTWHRTQRGWSPGRCWRWMEDLRRSEKRD